MTVTKASLKPLAAILLIVAQGISSQPVQSEVSNLSKDDQIISNESKQSVADSMMKISDEKRWCC